MSSHSEHEVPWIFRRDELDLFEREYEQLRSLSRRSRRRSLRQVFQEQEETEARAQAELELLLAPFDLNDETCPIHDEELAHDDVSLEELLEPISSFDELSARASAWSRGLREAIGIGDEEHLEKLRIRMNAPLIVAKCAFAAEEEAIGDEPAVIIADKELELAETYLQRVLKSLEQLGREEQLTQSLVLGAISSGNLLLRCVQKRRLALING